MVNDTGLLFDVEDEVLAGPARSVPAPVVSGSQEDLTPVAGVALWGPLLDRLNPVAEADRRGRARSGPAWIFHRGDGVVPLITISSF